MHITFVHLSVGRCTEYWRCFGHFLGRNGKFCVTRTAGVVAYCMLAELGLTLTILKAKGDELLCNGPHVELLLLLKQQ